MKRGVIYQKGSSTEAVKISRLILKLKLAAKSFRILGIILMGAAAFGLVFFYIPLMSAEVRYTWSKTKVASVFRKFDKEDALNKKNEDTQRLRLQGKEVPEQWPEWTVPDENYSIYIPKIYAKSRVIANVDTTSTKKYLAALKSGVAEAAGLAHPGQTGTTYLFAHSVGSSVDFVRYNAVFYLLDKLSKGDGIEIMYQNKFYKYQVESREILAANDVTYLIPQNLSEKLVLQTCYPPGTTWKRLIIVARRTY